MCKPFWRRRLNGFKKAVSLLLALVLCAVLTVGAGLTMAYFVHDVGLDETLSRIASLLGEDRPERQALWFALGTAAGMLLFFYPPGKKVPGILDIYKEEYQKRIDEYEQGEPEP